MAGFAVLALRGQEGRGLAWGVAATMLITAALGLESIARRLKGTVLELMGNASYSIYLWHTIFLVLIDGIVLRVSSNEAVRVGTVSVFCILGSVAIHWCLERPLTRSLGRMSAVGAWQAQRGSNRTASPPAETGDRTPPHLKL